MLQGLDPYKSGVKLTWGSPKRFLDDYAQEVLFTVAVGEDEHDGNMLEQTANMRANAAMLALGQGKDPYEPFQVSLYGGGYAPVPGKLRDWLAWDARAGGDLTNAWRLYAMRESMGLDPEVGWNG